jgi:hypothetical protein
VEKGKREEEEEGEGEVVCLSLCPVGSRRNKLSLSEKFVSAVATGACGLLLDDMYKRYI